MSQVLSQEEVDALLNGLSDGEVETTAQDVIKDPSSVRDYDLTRQDSISRDRMPALEMITEKFVRLFQKTLLLLLRKTVVVNVLSVGMAKYGDFIQKIPLSTSLNVFKMAPLKGNALLVIDSNIIFTIIDIIFGGSGRSPFKVDGRDFTNIEKNIVKKVVLSALKDLETVWELIKKLDIAYVKSETNPQFAQIALPADGVVIIKLELDMEFTKGAMTFCIPYATVEPIINKLQAEYQMEKRDIDQKWAKGMVKGLRNSTITLTVNLGQTELKGKEIVNLKKGDVIPLDQYCNESLNIYVEDILKFKGHPGVYRSNQAILITELIDSVKEELSDGTK